MSDRAAGMILALVALLLIVFGALIGDILGSNEVSRKDLFIPISNCQISPNGQVLSFDIGSQTTSVNLRTPHERPANFQNCTGLRTAGIGSLVILNDQTEVFRAVDYDSKFKFTDIETK